MSGTVTAFSAVLLAAIVWSLTPVLIKIGASNVSAIAFNGLRAFSALTLLLPLSLVVNGGVYVDPTPSALIVIVLSALVGLVVGDVAYVKAIQLAGVSKAVIIGYTYIFVSQILAFILLNEGVGIGTVMGSILAIIGIVLVVGGTQEFGYSHELRGLLAAGISSLAWGLGSVVNRVALLYSDPVSLALIRIAIQGATLTILDFDGLRSAMTNRRAVLTAFITGILTYGIGATLFLYSLQILGVSITVLATALTPVLSTILTRALTREVLGVKTIVGALCTASGIALAFQL